LKSSKADYTIENGVVNFLDPDYTYIQQDMMHNISDVDVMKNKLGEAVFNNHLREQTLGLNAPNFTMNIHALR
jgi:hypothetical protein